MESGWQLGRPLTGVYLGRLVVARTARWPVGPMIAQTPGLFFFFFLPSLGLQVSGLRHIRTRSPGALFGLPYGVRVPPSSRERHSATQGGRSWG